MLFRSSSRIQNYAQKSLAFLYTNDENSETEIKKTLPFTTATKQKKYYMLGTSLVVHWVRLHTPNAGGLGSIPDGRTKIPQAAQRAAKKKDIWGFLVLNASILKNWTSVTEIFVGIFQTWRKQNLTKNISQVVWKEAKELAKSREEKMKSPLHLRNRIKSK